jgi:hypothetical protein
MALPEFKVEQVEIDERTGTHSRYAVICPRCGEDFWVKLSWAVLRWVDQDESQGRLFIIGRPCPWCSKTAAIPSDIRVTPSEPRSPRVVRRRRDTRTPHMKIADKAGGLRTGNAGRVVPKKKRKS